MNLVDLVLAILLVLCALRGYLRGLIRESFGFVAFLIGLLAALRLADSFSAYLSGWDLLAGLPDAALAGAAFVALFLLVSASINLFGFIFDRFVGKGLLRRVAQVGGGLFGVFKGACVLAFILLFLSLFPFVNGLDDQLVASRLARPMISAADNLLRGNWSAIASPEEPV